MKFEWNNFNKINGNEIFPFRMLDLIRNSETNPIESRTAPAMR